MRIIAVTVNEEEFNKITTFCKKYGYERSGFMRQLTLRFIQDYKEPRPNGI